MQMDYGNIREFLSWMAALFVDGIRRDLPRFCGGFGVLAPGPFQVGWCGCGCGGWFLRAGWTVRLDHNGLHGG